MLRRLITCLALITGLAAVSTPAAAAIFDPSDERVSSSQCARSDRVARCICVIQRGGGKNGRKKVIRCRPRKTVTVVIPTVQLGPDRAYE